MCSLLKKTKRGIKTELLNLGFDVKKTVSDEQLNNFLQELYPIQPPNDLIRVGPKGDGGYLMPNDLQVIKYCFSAGVANKAEFETNLIERGIYCFLADLSISASPINSNKVRFDRKNLGALNDESYMTLDSWVADRVGDEFAEMIAQIDIEGDEYQAILATKEETLTKFQHIIIEFHNLDLNYEIRI